ncbi:hypothetical protein PMAYCL1PPCAC_23970, partial [Pristionchus mayeri]
MTNGWLLHSHSLAISNNTGITQVLQEDLENSTDQLDRRKIGNKVSKLKKEEEKYVKDKAVAIAQFYSIPISPNEIFSPIASQCNIPPLVSKVSPDCSSTKRDHN